MRIESLDLNLIIALEAILRLKSVSAAAKELRLTQPAVSRALARLREHFGDELAVPIGRRMAPTAFGERIFAVASQLLNETRTFAQLRPSFDPAAAERSFAIGASDYVSTVFLTRLARDLAKSAPGLSLRVISADLVDEAMIDRRDVDFVIMPEMILSPRQPRQPLFRDGFVCVAAADKPEIGKRLDKRTYLRLRHVTTAFGPAGGESHFERFLRMSGVRVATAIAAPSFTQLANFLAGTPFVATIHKRLAKRLQGDPALRFFPPPLAVPPLVEHLQWHRAHEHDAACKWLRGRMLDLAAREMDEEPK